MNIDFVGKRHIFIFISLILVIVGFVYILTKGFNLGIDFAGGTEFVIQTDKDVSISYLRDMLMKIDPNYSTAKIIKLKTGAALEGTYLYSITLKKAFYGEVTKKETLINKIKEALKQDKIKSEILEFNDVSGFAAEEIRSYAWYAVMIILILLLAYISLRFKPAFGVGAIIALAHDILITLGFYSMFGIEINVAAIAAFLTLAGYSLNDTIVVYDRIRENLKKLRGKSIDQIVNTSINQVIVRSLNTSITTFIVVFLMLLMGGKPIIPFAFGLTVGVIVGTYSSLYIASPVVIGWLRRTKRI